jgi:dephospho-CoA kinase
MKIIIGLVGETGAGKETLVQLFTELVLPHTVFHLSTSAFLKRTLDEWNIKPTRENLQTLIIRMAEGFGGNVLTLALENQIRQSVATFVVYDCIRLQSDFDLIRSCAPNLILYITSDVKTRWQRTKLRAAKHGEKNATFEQFLASEQRLTETAIPEFGRQADFTIVNSSNREHLRENIRWFMQFYAKPKLNA